MNLTGIFAVIELGETLGKFAGVIIGVPIPAIGEGQALRHRQAERMNVIDIDQQTSQFLTGFGDAEFSRTLDRIGGIAVSLSNEIPKNIYR